MKVVNLKESKIQDELIAEIEFLEELKKCSKVVDIFEHELKTAEDVKGLPFAEMDTITEQQGMCLRFFCLPFNSRFH